MPEPLSGVEPPRLLPGTGSGPAAYTIPPQGHVHTARGDHDDRCRGRRTLCWCPRVDSNHHALTGTGPQPAAYTIPPRGLGRLLAVARSSIPIRGAGCQPVLFTCSRGSLIAPATTGRRMLAP